MSKRCQPPVKDFYFVYKCVKIDDIQNEKSIFEQLNQIGELKNFDRLVVSYQNEHRLSNVIKAVGIVVPVKSVERLEKLLSEKDFKVHFVKNVKKVVQIELSSNKISTNPHEFKEICQEFSNQLNKDHIQAYPLVQFYSNNKTIHFAPLLNQTNFYVPETHIG
ncbi:unnamed protein product [Brachionus calyciflorus]|uniref:Uncharacterized protein n=1 Tax=Brachionus calyciflorus TaxID=104777 RepID=A0A814KZ34_9BILA|nr:unnamed protein product [Brachionus calyciflorus]